MMVIERTLKKQVVDSLRDFPVVGIIGPRQVGKTTLAKSIWEDYPKETIYLDLERISDAQKLQEAELFFTSHSNKLIILDEVQRMPSLFPLLRSLVDLSSENGRFLILGSASPAISRQSSESLAGRICYHSLTGFLIEELDDGKKSLDRLWLRGMFPKSFLAATDEKSITWRESFIRTHLERDIPALGLQSTPSMMLRFWQMISHCQGQLWNANKIAGSLGVSPTTIRRYLDILQDTFMIRQLLPYHVNVKKRLVKSPKVYIRDSGLLHTLLNINTYEDLLGHPSAGASWEGWVLEQLLAVLPSRWTVHFYRTASGAEIDLLIHPTQMKPPVAVEIKRSLSPDLSRSFSNAWEDLQPKAGFVIYPGAESYPIRESIRTWPADQLCKIPETIQSEL